MPKSLYIHITPVHALSLQPYTSSGLGWLLALINQVDPDLSDYLHGTGSPREFTTSTWISIDDEDILSERRGEPKPLIPTMLVQPGQRASLRIATSNDAVIATILDALAIETCPPLLGQPVNAVDVPPAFDPATSPHCFDCPWEALLAAPEAKKVDICFASPTAFSSQGVVMLQPEVRLLVESWYRKWCAWGGPDLPSARDLQVLSTSLVIESYTLATTVHGHGQARNRGFSGKLGLVIPRGVPGDVRSTITALCGFANFCGTGAKSNFGFGQTRLQVS